MRFEVNGHDVKIEGNKAILFNGSYIVTYKKGTSIDKIKRDVEENIEKYRDDDYMSFCRANGFYD